MKIGIACFTEKGRELSLFIKEQMKEAEIELTDWHGKEKQEESLIQWTGRQFERRTSLIFVGACGIAVRTIAPFVRDKLTDSGVLVVDEKGQFVIPLLSGHMGGANRLAQTLAERIGGICVITTATDINGCFAVDVFARENGLAIRNREGIAKVSGRLLSGETVTVYVEGGRERLWDTDLPKGLVLTADRKQAQLVIAADKTHTPSALLVLRPREYVLGLGCKKGKPFEEIRDFIGGQLGALGLTEQEIAGIASVDQKKDEPGIKEWSQRLGIPFVTFSPGQLGRVEGSFHGSDFVKETVGVENVCERAALALCEGHGELILPKTAKNGMTLAVAKREWKIRWR